MPNSIVAGIVTLLFVMNLILVIIVLVNQKKKPVHRSFLLLSIFVMLWLLSDILFFACANTTWAVRLLDVKLVFVTFTCVAVFFFTMRFYRLDKHITPSLVAAILVIPIITSILALSSEWHQLIRKTLVIIQTQPEYIIINERGVWFWIHAAYSYLLLITSTIITAQQHGALPKSSRLSSTMLLIGVPVSLASNALLIFRILDMPFDITSIGISLSLVFFYAAISSNDVIDFLILARNDIFNFLYDPIFILDKNHTVLDVNASAKAWAQKLGIEGNNSYKFEDVLSRLSPMDAYFSQREYDDFGVSTYLADQKNFSIYILRERPVYDKQNALCGTFATFTDFTRYKKLIDQLEVEAGIDPLTGLANRRQFEIVLESVNVGANLPLSVIVGDVNAMKTVNDTMGHHMGDKLLKDVAQRLKQFCPRGGIVARIGGDEFTMLLPVTCKDDAAKIMDAILASAVWEKFPAFFSDISLGAATKTAMEQDIRQLVEEADRNMYKTKKANMWLGSRK